MNRFTWRQFASGLLVATLSVGIAACDDDTTSGGGDMSGSVADMSATAGDMPGGTPGNGQLTLADVVGTVYSPALPNGLAPRTHTLIGVASMPQFAGMSDPSSDFGVTPTIHGCSIYRYTATNLPGVDGDAGEITFSGFNTAYTIGVNGANGSTSASPMAGSSPIKCTRSATTMQYGCAYSGMGGPDAGAAGASTSSVIYPVIPAYIVDHATHGGAVKIPVPPAMGGWPYGDATCIPRFSPRDATTDFLVCEQSPIVPLGVSEIVETVAGGTDWPAAMATLGNGGGTDGGTAQLAGPLYISSVKSGSTDITGTDLLTQGPSLDIGDGKIDVTKDLVIAFSCDATDPTPGAKCTGTQDLLGLLITTSTNKKALFSAPSTATGSATCSQPVAAGSTVTVKAAQLTALVGTQTGGSYQIALVRLSTKLQSPAGVHGLLAFTAGMGTFGFTNQ